MSNVDPRDWSDEELFVSLITVGGQLELVAAARHTFAMMDAARLLPEDQFEGFMDRLAAIILTETEH